jgi:hypothetical protein
MRNFFNVVTSIVCLSTVWFVLNKSNQSTKSTSFSRNEKRSLMDIIDLAMQQEYEMTKDPATRNVP